MIKIHLFVLAASLVCFVVLVACVTSPSGDERRQSVVRILDDTVRSKAQRGAQRTYYGACASTRIVIAANLSCITVWYEASSGLVHAYQFDERFIRKTFPPGSQLPELTPDALDWVRRPIDSRELEQLLYDLQFSSEDTHAHARK